MKKGSIISALLLSMVLFHSCQKKEKFNQNDLFGKTFQNLTFEDVLSDELGVFYGGYADKFLMIEQNQIDTSGVVFHVYDSESLEFLGKIGRRGRGPGEFLWRTPGWSDKY